MTDKTPKDTGGPTDTIPDFDSKNGESLLQPGRQFTLAELAEELPGQLDVPPDPEATGGHADIYRGIWTNPQGEKIEVALKKFRKLVPRDRNADREALERRTETRIKREVFVWSQTKHHNLHPLLGYRLQPQPSLISPWCRHGNLWDYLRGSPDLSRLEKLKLIYQVARGLNHLHIQAPPICHGDIKPENVLINDQLEAVLSDFGLGRVLTGLGVSSGFTTRDVAPGTLSYMAGELLTEEKPKSNCETDVYAFGGLVLAVMSGKPPFFGLHKTNIMVRVMQCQPPTVEEHQELPASDPLWSLMRRCWENIPSARPSMQYLLSEFSSHVFAERSNQLFGFSGRVEELAGDLETPDRPWLSTRYGDIYYGIWISPTGERTEVAIKRMRLVIPRSKHIDVEAWNKRKEKRIKQEAYVWNLIQHPNIDPLLGYRLRPAPTFISPFYRHGDLSYYLEEHPELSRLDRLKLSYQTACGLEYLHSRAPSICHGDIRPESVLINDRVEAVLSRFSLAGVMADLGAPFWSSDEMHMDKGHFNYMAPELFTKQARVACEVDSYAFGGLILSVMSGRPPFGKRSVPATIYRTMQGDLPRQEEHPLLESSDPLWNLMRRCWSKAPVARPTMQEVCSELRELINREQYDAGEIGGGYSQRDPDPSNEGGEGGTPASRTLNHPPVGGPLSSRSEAEETVNPIHKDENFTALNLLKSLELESQDIPIIGEYIGTAVEVGLTLFDIVRTINAHKSEAESLGSHTRKLVDLLKDLKELSQSRRGDEAGLRITDTQKELQSVRVLLRKWDKSGLFRDAFAASDNAAESERKEETVRNVLEKIQLLVNSTAGLITELEESW